MALKGLGGLKLTDELMLRSGIKNDQDFQTFIEYSKVTLFILSWYKYASDVTVLITVIQTHLGILAILVILAVS